MKIVKRIDPVAELPKEVICKYCQSVIELETGADIKSIPTTATTNQGKGWTCPVCSKVNCINIG